MKAKILRTPQGDRVGFWQRRHHEIMRAKKGKGAYRRQKEKRAYFEMNVSSSVFKRHQSDQAPGNFLRKVSTNLLITEFSTESDTKGSQQG